MCTANLLSDLDERKMRQDNESELYSLSRDLSAFVTNHTNDILVEQYQLSKDLRFTDVTTIEQRNMRQHVFLVRSAAKPPSKVSHRRPLYARTRLLTVKEIDGPNGRKLVLSVLVGISSYICVHAGIFTASLTDNPTKMMCFRKSVRVMRSYIIEMKSSE